MNISLTTNYDIGNYIFEVNLSRLFRNLIHVPFNHLLQLFTATNILLMQPIFQICKDSVKGIELRACWWQEQSMRSHLMQCLRYHPIIQISFGIEMNLVQISDKIRFLRILRVSIKISQALHSFEASDNIRAELRPRIKSFFNLEMQDSFHCCPSNY